MQEIQEAAQERLAKSDVDTQQEQKDNTENIDSIVEFLTDPKKRREYDHLMAGRFDTPFYQKAYSNTPNSTSVEWADLSLQEKWKVYNNEDFREALETTLNNKLEASNKNKESPCIIWCYTQNPALIQGSLEQEIINIIWDFLSKKKLNTTPLDKRTILGVRLFLEKTFGDYFKQIPTGGPYKGKSFLYIIFENYWFSLLETLVSQRWKNIDIKRKKVKIQGKLVPISDMNLEDAPTNLEGKIRSILEGLKLPLNINEYPAGEYPTSPRLPIAHLLRAPAYYFDDNQQDGLIEGCLKNGLDSTQRMYLIMHTGGGKSQWKKYRPYSYEELGGIGLGAAAVIGVTAKGLTSISSKSSVKKKKEGQQGSGKKNLPYKADTRLKQTRKQP